MVSVLEALVDTKRKKSDNRVFHLQDLYQPSIGQRKPAKAPGLGKPPHRGPESMTTSPRCRNPGGLCPYSPNKRLVVGNTQGSYKQHSRYCYKVHVLSHYGQAILCIAILRSLVKGALQSRSRLANRGRGLLLHIRGLFANSEEPSVFIYSRRVHRPRFRLASRTLG